MAINMQNTRADIERELNRLERKQRVMRWIDLSLGVMLVTLGFWSNHSNWLREFLSNSHGVLLASLGGAFVGAATRSWHGCQELKLARAALDSEV